MSDHKIDININLNKKIEFPKLINTKHIKNGVEKAVKKIKLTFNNTSDVSKKIATFTLGALALVGITTYIVHKITYAPDKKGTDKIKKALKLYKENNSDVISPSKFEYRIYKLKKNNDPDYNKELLEEDEALEQKSGYVYFYKAKPMYCAIYLNDDNESKNDRDHIISFKAIDSLIKKHEEYYTYKYFADRYMYSDKMSDWADNIIKKYSKSIKEECEYIDYDIDSYLKESINNNYRDN